MERIRILVKGSIGLAIALALLLQAPASATPDWNRLDDPLVSGVGLHVGKIGGTGLAFKYPPVWFLQFQAAGGLWHTTNHQRHNLGLEAHYLLRQDPRWRFFLLAGLGYSNHRERVEDASGHHWNDNPNWNSGFGVGLEYLKGDRWSVQVDLDFTYQDDDSSITVWPQAGLFFYW